MSTDHHNTPQKRDEAEDVLRQDHAGIDNQDDNTNLDDTENHTTVKPENASRRKQLNNGAENTPADHDINDDNDDDDDDDHGGNGDGNGGDNGGGNGGDNGGGAEDESEDPLRTMLARNFIEYASYVVKDRAIPDVDDGLKPVQRRILHCMHRVDDGRFNKVAGIVGDTMHFHPHGDRSIGDALVVLANKKYFIESQGNFGNILTGDPAAAARYIEARLTPLAREVMFNPEITEYVDSYDGRNREPVCLPCKVPSLLMLGADGIAVGMMTRIFPHNFRELLEAQIAILENRPFQLFPDFPHGGLMDVSEYDDGAGRIRLRARIEAEGDKKIIIREIPATTTTESLIASIENAAKRGRLKIASITDYTAKNVAIEIALQRNIYAEETIRELYAYTDCEMQVNSILCVIRDNIPSVMTVSQVLRRNTEKLLDYHRQELAIALHKLEEKHQEKTLAQIFIEHRIYKRIEQCETLEKVKSEISRGLEKFRDRLRRDITEEDIEKLLQIPIRRISLFDIRKNEEELVAIAKDMEQTIYHQGHLVEYTVAYIRRLLEKHAQDFPRQTEIASFSTVNVREIARRDVKVFHDRVNYYLGTNVKPSSKDGAPVVCTAFDRLVLLRNDGSCRVISVPEKEYIGPTKYVLLADKEQIYSILYRDRLEGTWFAKRFRIGQFMLGKEYHVLPKNCIIENLYTNSGVVLSLELAANHRRSYHSVTVDFDSMQLRSRDARGFKLTHYPVTEIKVIKRGTTAPAEEQQPSPDDDKPGPGQPNGADNGRTPPTPTATGGQAPPADTPKTTAPKTPGDTRTAADTNGAKDTNAAKDANGAKDATPTPPAKPTPKSSLKLLIDEKTPFFLEDE